MGQTLVLLGEVAAGALVQLARHGLVEALDGGELLDRHVGHLLDRGEALGHQQVGDDVVDVERLDEHRASAA